MGTEHPKSHHHGHRGRDGGRSAGGASPKAPPSLDRSIPDAALPPGEASRRSVLRAAGLLGVGTAAATLATPAAQAVAGGTPEPVDRHGHRRSRAAGLVWLAGDHHVHTQFSSDAVYRVADSTRHAGAYGLDWLVITDHGGAEHARIGVEKVNPEIRAAREAFRDLLVFQGLEWNIPAAEHGTVFVHPGRNEVALLKEFESAFDGVVRGATDPTPANEALAIAGVDFLADAVARRRIDDVLFVANHPARKGLDSPHEIRAWRDAQPRIAVGMEGAPGHQAAGIKAPNGPGVGRGNYDNAASAVSFAGYPPESYRTWGGFDWMTATVGGVWDSLLAEGRPWWITANSDSHWVYGDGVDRGPDDDFTANAVHSGPVHGSGVGLTNSDFWPGFYSRTHVGARSFSYAAVMEGIRDGRIWVDHGSLIGGLDVQVRVAGAPSGVTLGGTLLARRGTRVDLVITIDLATTPNWAQFVPVLARVDVIAGEVTGPVANRDTFTAPGTRVVQSFEVNRSAGRITLTYPVGRVNRPLYLRLRGTDGNRSAPGAMGAGVDPVGPAIDVIGDADPWRDLWFYTNPIWVMPRA